MTCSTCSSHGLNGGINANFARDVTLKISTCRGQRYVGLVILVSQNKLTKLLMGPRICHEDFFVKHGNRLGCRNTAKSKLITVNDKVMIVTLQIPFSL